jgi:hypothetical protein
VRNPTKSALESWISKEFLARLADQTSVELGLPEIEPENRLRTDARLIQILRGVRAGIIQVEDAALEVIENRGLDRKSFLLDSTAACVLTTATEQQWVYKPKAVDVSTLLGMPVKIADKFTLTDFKFESKWKVILPSAL